MKGKKIGEIFKNREEFQIYKAPGRINIIGEHTDYNKGYVLPAAIDRHIQLAIRKNHLHLLRAYSMEFPGLVIQKIPFKKIGKKDGWIKYLKAVLLTLQKKIGFTGYSGLDVYVTGDIPVGAGLSSSAALEVAFLFALNDLFDLQLEPIDMAYMAQEAENEFVGVQCGIMDQFISLMGKENYALFLDVGTMNYQYIPLTLNERIFILINTGVSHNLRNSEYNDRRLECEEGLKIIRDCLHSPVKSLSEVKLKDIQQCRKKFPPHIYKRVIYVAEENLRVKAMIKALKNQSFSEAGRLLYSSHNGLKYLYEVSCPELDLIVDYLRISDGVIGARMMGGGFGGCVLALVQKKQFKRIFSSLKEKYHLVFQKHPTLFPIAISHGLAEKGSSKHHSI